MLLKHQTMDIRLVIPWLLFLVTVNGLRDVRVTVPAAVKRGDNAELICLYDMEGDSLYSVKWYRREFENQRRHYESTRLENQEPQHENPTHVEFDRRKDFENGERRTVNYRDVNETQQVHQNENFLQNDYNTSEDMGAIGASEGPIIENQIHNHSDRSNATRIPEGCQILTRSQIASRQVVDRKLPKFTVNPLLQMLKRHTKLLIFAISREERWSRRWYKGRREFYRYTPKENPAMKTFVVSNINVERSMSDESRLTLMAVEPSVSGKYSCEVSADAPSFHTLIESGDLEVVEVPESRPSITGIRTRYRVGDSLRANCSSKHSKPAGNLTWIVNDIPPNPLYVRTYRTSKDHRTDLETSLSGIQFVITDQHFIKGKLKIRCVSQIHDIYFQKTEKTIEHDRPKPSASASNSVNAVHNIPYDQYVPHDGDKIDKQDSYMTQIQGDMSSLSGYKAYSISANILIYSQFILILLSQFNTLSS